MSSNWSCKEIFLWRP